MISYKTIHQTDKEHDGGDLSKAWRDLNEPDGWSYNFLNDNQAAEWIADIWAGSNVEWSWQYMHRGVLRADFLRYLLILVRGGVYSDVDVGDTIDTNEADDADEAYPTHRRVGHKSSRDTQHFRHGRSGLAVQDVNAPGCRRSCRCGCVSTNDQTDEC